MEGHLVHNDSHGELAVIGVFMKKGHANPFFQSLADNLPSQADEENAVAGTIVNVQDMFPADRSIYTYSGSLTTPPCSENVSWNVLSTPVEVSSRQIAAFASILKYNARPVQPLNGRAISGQGGSQVSATQTTPPQLRSTAQRPPVAKFIGATAIWTDPRCGPA